VARNLEETMNLRHLITTLTLGLAALLLTSTSSPEVARVHQQLVDLPPAYVELDIETPEQRSKRFWELARVIAEYPRQMQRWLIVKAFRETRLAAYTRNDCRGQVPKGAANCDDGDSRTHWQLKSKACPEVFRARDNEVVRVAVKCAADRLAKSFRKCKTPAEAFAHYGSWRCVATKTSKAKALMLARMRGVK
jgi:hypothetical protein